MTTPKRFLFALMDGGGNVPPDTSVARALVERGHEVRVLADAVLAPDVEATGAEHIPWSAAPQRPDLDPRSLLIQDWDARTPLGAFARARDGVMCGPAALYAEDVRAELRRRPADAVVTSVFLLGAQIAAEAEGVPAAVLVANVLSLPGWGLPPFGPGVAPARGPLGRARDAFLFSMMRRSFDAGLPALNAARRANGLEENGSVLDQLRRADLVLLMIARAFEYEGFSPPAHVRVTGPRLDDPAWAGDWSPPPGDEPLVLVGMSSTFMDHAAVLQRVVAGLGSLPVRGLVTTGPAISPADLDAPANVTVVERAPHSEVLRHASAVVTHAGHGTLIKALAAGVPVVTLPLGRDQLENAARAQHHGVGVRLRPGAPPASVARAVGRVLEEPSFRSAAERMAAAIRAETEGDRAADELEALALSISAAPVRG